jgi:membrane-associated phospholipid phosphatase
MRFIFSLTLLIICNSGFSNEPANKDSIIPISKVFYKLGANTVHTFTYNYGINSVVAIAGTYGLVESGIDWKINKFSYENKVVAYSGMPSVAVGGLVPLAVPLGFYIYGRKHGNTKLQITGLALGQAAILGAGLTTTIKVFTGRRPPGILQEGDEAVDHSKDYSDDFAFGILRRGAFNGWPSGHTTTAFAMAVTLTELYPENKALKIGAITYASLVGLGVSVNIHWFSDAFAGVLLGYAIGKTVGTSFKQLMNNEKPTNLSFYVVPQGAGCVWRF